MPKISVYVDGGPFMDGIRYQSLPLDFDMKALFRDLASASELHEVHFFVPEYPEQPYPNKRRNEKARFEAIGAQGIRLHLCRTQLIGSVFVERGVEAALAAQIIPDAYGDRFDTALVISRRPDLAPVIAAVKERGKRVETAFFRYDDHPANPLEAACDASKVITRDQVLRHCDSNAPAPSL